MKKYLSILFALVLVLSLSLVTAVPAGATYGTPTINGVLDEGEWGAPTFVSEGYFKVYVMNDAEYLYVGFETLGGTYLPTGGGDVGMINVYTMNPETWECWVYCWIHRTPDLIELKYTYPPDPTETLDTDADFGVTATVFELQIPLSELESISLGDTIHFHFLSYAEGWTDWATCWLYNQEYTLAAPPVTTATLFAGQDIPVGTVSVWDDGTNLYVKYETTDGWEMTETHLHVAEDVGAIPQTEAKGKSTGGNPIPGHFDYKMEHDCVTEYTYEIPLEWGAGTPLYIAAHAVVIKVIEAPYYASTVVDSEQGLRKDGTPVRWQRSTPEQGLAFETGKDEFNFFSLGFGGEIIVEFDCPIRNGEGDDVQIIEDTWGAYPLETADVYASQDGNSWQLLGEADNTTRYLGIHTISQFDLDDLPWAKYTKIVDTADPNDFAGRPDADGFDLNAVVSLQDYIQEETAWAGYEVGELPFPGKNWATYFEYTVSE